MEEHAERWPSQQPPVAAPRILVIDDEEVIHVSIRRILGRCGYDVHCELTAPQGLERLSSEEFDLVITDLMMPGMTGIELLESMKEQQLAVPVLLITGYPTIRTALQALRLGALDYIAKPFTRQELLAPVNRTLRRVAGSGPERAAEQSADGEEPLAQSLELVPGDRLHLRGHGWAVYQQDGTMQIGIEESYFDSIGGVATVELPSVGDIVEQGLVGFRLLTQQAEEHGVFMPLTGLVVAVNGAAAASPARIGPTWWLVRIVPSRLAEELPLLMRR